jgi:hypothetical protein
MTCKPPLYMGPEYIKYFSDKTIDVSPISKRMIGPLTRDMRSLLRHWGQGKMTVKVFENAE